MHNKLGEFDQDDLCYAPATELIPLFAAGKITPLQVLEAQIARIALHDRGVNAVVAKHFEEARERAKASGERYRTNTARPLEGVTVAVKDDLKVKGWSNGLGCIPLARLAGQPAPKDSPIVEFLRAAGAVMHIQTAVPEFCWHAVTWSRLTGVTGTPWNTAYAAGGSSGGSGAALASGFTTLATGSDIGGSIRIPAAFTGVCGFKPPFGRVPSGQTHQASNGPMARTVADLALMQNVLCGPHPSDLPSLRSKLDYSVIRADVRGAKVAVVYPDDKQLVDLDASVRASMEQAVKVYKAQGCTVDEVRLDTFTKENRKLFARALFAGAGMTMQRDVLAPYRDLVCRNTRMVMDGFPRGAVDGMDLFKGDELGERMHSEIQEKIFGRGYSALLMPTLATPFVPANWEENEDVDHVIINGVKTYGYIWILTWIFNLLSRYPVVNVPVGLGPKNIPLGMQVVANTYEDLEAFRFARAYHDAAPKLYTEGRFPTFEHSV